MQTTSQTNTLARLDLTRFFDSMFRSLRQFIRIVLNLVSKNSIEQDKQVIKSIQCRHIRHIVMTGLYYGLDYRLWLGFQNFARSDHCELNLLCTVITICRADTLPELWLPINVTDVKLTTIVSLASGMTSSIIGRRKLPEVWFG